LLFAEEPQDARGIQPQTAYELSLKQQNLAQKIGPLFSRLQQECLEPIFMRFSYILHKMGKLPRPKLDGVPIRFRYKSPLALVKGQQEMSRFIQFVQTMQGIMGPEATQVYINPKTTPYLLADSLQIDARYLNNPQAVADTMQNVQNQHNMQQLANSQASTPEAPQNPSNPIVTTGQ
jgi:hypothetical protein